MRNEESVFGNGTYNRRRFYRGSRDAHDTADACVFYSRKRVSDIPLVFEGRRRSDTRTVRRFRCRVFFGIFHKRVAKGALSRMGELHAGTRCKSVVYHPSGMRGVYPAGILSFRDGIVSRTLRGTIIARKTPFVRGCTRCTSRVCERRTTDWRKRKNAV